MCRRPGLRTTALRKGDQVADGIGMLISSKELIDLLTACRPRAARFIGELPADAGHARREKTGAVDRLGGAGAVQVWGDFTVPEPEATAEVRPWSPVCVVAAMATSSMRAGSSPGLRRSSSRMVLTTRSSARVRLRCRSGSPSRTEYARRRQRRHCVELWLSEPRVSSRLERRACPLDVSVKLSGAREGPGVRGLRKHRQANP